MTEQWELLWGGRVAAEAPTQTDMPQMARRDNAFHVSEITLSTMFPDSEISWSHQECLAASSRRLSGAPRLTLCVGAKRNWQGSQERSESLLSPETAGRASLGHAEVFTGVNIQKHQSCISCPNRKEATPSLRMWPPSTPCLVNWCVLRLQKAKIKKSSLC